LVVPVPCYNAGMDDNMKDILDSLIFIKERMATKDDIAELKESVDKLDSRMTAVESKIGGIHTRIDDETAQRKNLEGRVRSVVPNLPPAPERV
jgi:hypothetical protein